MGFKELWSEPNPWVLAIVGGILATVVGALIVRALLRRKPATASPAASGHDEGVVTGGTGGNSEVLVAREQGRAIQVNVGPGGTLNMPEIKLTLTLSEQVSPKEIQEIVKALNDLHDQFGRKEAPEVAANSERAEGNE